MGVKHFVQDNSLIAVGLSSSAKRLTPNFTSIFTPILLLFLLPFLLPIFMLEGTDSGDRGPISRKWNRGLRHR